MLLTISLCCSLQLDSLTAAERLYGEQRQRADDTETRRLDILGREVDTARRHIDTLELQPHRLQGEEGGGGTEFMNFLRLTSHCVHLVLCEIPV